MVPIIVVLLAAIQAGSALGIAGQQDNSVTENDVKEFLSKNVWAAEHFRSLFEKCVKAPDGTDPKSDFNNGMYAFVEIVKKMGFNPDDAFTNKLKTDLLAELDILLDGFDGKPLTEKCKGKYTEIKSNLNSANFNKENLALDFYETLDQCSGDGKEETDGDGEAGLRFEEEEEDISA